MYFTDQNGPRGDHMEMNIEQFSNSEINVKNNLKIR